MLDHRLVQTAVIGHKNSDHPVILPMDAWELDRWRGAHPGYSYWCGLQLGGCGGELSDRRYTTKVCHFAHHPAAPVCHRKNNGESSADHLFIKRGVQRLLGKQKVRGRVETRDLGTGPGDAVDVYLPGSRRRLRFQLNAVDYRTWRRADDELAADADGIDWIFSSEGPITQQFTGRHGYCLRVRCETVGGERRVHIGAEARDRTVSWTPLEDCAVTPTGIVTPDTERIRLTRPRPRPSAFPLQGGLVFAFAPEADVPADSPFAAKDRHLLMADVKPVDSPIVRALVSLPGDTEVPPAEHVYRVVDGARLLIAEGAAGWAVEANRYVRLNAHEAQRTGLWTPLTSPAAAVPARWSSESKKHEPPRETERASVARAPETPVALSTATEEVRGLVSQLDELRPQLSEFPRKQAQKAVRQARAWLALRDGRQLSTRQRKRFTMEAPENPVVRLENALRVAEEDIKRTAWLEKYENGLRAANRTRSKPHPLEVQAGTEDPVDRLTRQLMTVAAREATIPAVLLDGGRVKPDFPRRLTAVDSKAVSTDPLLSALVTGPDGGPVPCFRDILAAVGLMVPQTDDALLKIWRREQERAYAAYGNPPRSLPPRLVPTASQAESPHT